MYISVIYNVSWTSSLQASYTHNQLSNSTPVIFQLTKITTKIKAIR